MIRLLTLTLIITLFAPHTVRAADGMSGVSLLNYCAGYYDVDAGFCAGYVSAIADIMKQEALFGHRACNLAPVPSQQLMELMQVEGKNSATNRAGTAPHLTAEILAKFYPCR